MKKIFSLVLASLILILSVPAVSASENPWEAAYRKVIDENRISDGRLIDINGDKTPELAGVSGGKVLFFYMKDMDCVKSYNGTDIPLVFFDNLKLMSAPTKNDTGFFGQAIYKGTLYTYRMVFSDFVPTLDIIAEENVRTGIGSVKLDNEVFAPSSDVGTAVAEYFEDYAENYITSAKIFPEEVRLLGRTKALNNAFGRYNIFAELSDNQVSFSQKQREKIKKTVSAGTFGEFSRISVLSDDYIFVEFFTNDTQNEKVILPYEKNFALLDGKLSLIESYRNEKDIDGVKLFPLIAVENAPANFNPDYKRTQAFRGIDDYVNFLSQIMPNDLTLNANGKKNLAQFMEYAVNRCSRAELKAQNNTLTVNKKAVSIVSQSATMAMGQLVSLCKSKNISQIRTARTIPELVCTGLDFSRPIRIEFVGGTSDALSGASGIRLMLDSTCGIYLNTAELAILEENADTFCIEYTKNDEDYSIIFTDEKSHTKDQILSPVWFIVPAKYQYSSVLASYEGGTENRGGVFDAKSSTIEFSAMRSGNYQVVEDDITINDTDNLPISKSEAIRFLVSKGVFELDKKNNFYPESHMTLFEFDLALHNMFYDSPCQTDSKKLRLTKEEMLASCGKVLVEKKGYQCPENFMDYLLFTDKTQITSENIPYIAVAVQCGLCENGGEFAPETFITKSDAADVLYRTYMLLYDASSVTTSLSATAVEEEIIPPAKTDISIAVRLGLCAGVTIVIALVVVIVTKKKKDDNEN